MLWICVAFFGLVLFSSYMLKLITNHGKTLDAPDFVAMTPQEAAVLAKSAGVRVEVIDTTYVKSVGRGCVFMQDPAAGAKVKNNRTIRLVVNASVPRKVPMPNVEECPVRQAVSDLTSKGFIVGRLNYVPGFDDRVQTQMLGSSRIAPGTMVESGSVINLTVGFDKDYSLTSVPDVRGKRSMQAQKEIKERSLNIRRIVFDRSVVSYADSINAVVYRQSPEPAAEQLVKGSEVSIWLSVDPAKISE